MTLQEFKEKIEAGKMEKSWLYTHPIFQDSGRSYNYIYAAAGMVLRGGKGKRVNALEALLAEVTYEEIATCYINEL